MIEAERMLGESQRRVAEDRILGGLALDVRKTGNDVDLDTYADKAVEGAVSLEVRCRYATDVRAPQSDRNGAKVGGMQTNSL